MREDAGSLVVCAILVGMHSTTISLSNIELIEGTAKEGEGMTILIMIVT